MSTRLAIPEDQLVPIEPPHGEPRLDAMEARRVNSLTLIHGKTFLATTVAGDIAPPGAPDLGFFHDDTRFLSHMELRVEGHRTLVLSSSVEKTFASQVELTAGRMVLRESYDLPENTVHIRREQLLGDDVFYDRITFENFNLEALHLAVELTYDADFVDVFQVRGCARARRGQHYRPVAGHDHFSFFYRGLDGVARQTLVEFFPPPLNISERTARWHLELPPLKKVHMYVAVTPRVEGNRNPTRDHDPAHSLSERRRAFEAWHDDCTQFRSGNDVFDVSLDTAISDFHALQIPSGGQHIIAAGIPWFAAIFGRDSIIAAYQSLFLNPRLAVDTLRLLAQLQGKEHNDWRDEEPGKIVHEHRGGEMTRVGELPFGPYYGSVDATPLFLILLSETFNWTGDEELVQELLPAAYKALEWIDRYGDLDGDGFVEYLRRSPKGLVNQGWKDSWDANMHRDGSVARPPIALVEVQGYVYDAKYRMASLLRSFGDVHTAERLRREASDLAKRFERAFWMPQRRFYAMGLDAEKRPLEVISSNPGHLLFTRMLPREKARAVVRRLMQDDMFSGWGLRTLSREERIFNPLSYHRGSVWPHENSLIVHGMALHEFRVPAVQVMTALFQASLRFRDFRLPELFCGLKRREHDEPVQYPVSCSPQAWASGAMFLMLSSVLGIRPSAPRRELNIINPVLPAWLDYFQVRNLRIGKSTVGLDFSRRGDRTYCNVVDVDGEKLVVNTVFKK